jgi:hypothetical protein
MRFLSPIFVVVVSFIVAGPVRAQNWVDLTPSTGPAPPARALASAVLDTQDYKMVVFGGLTPTARLKDVWEFDLATHTWAEVTPSTGSSPQQRNSPVSVYDPVGHRMVTWSGQRPGVFFNDAWAFDLTTNLWSEYTPAGGPPNQRYGAAGVYDPTAGDLVTFAGFTSSGRFDDVWRLDAAGATYVDRRVVDPRSPRALPALGQLRLAGAPVDHVRGTERGTARRHVGLRPRAGNVD